MSILAGASQSLLSLSGVVSLEIRLENMAYRSHFIFVDRLAVNVLVEPRFLKGHLQTINFERVVLVFQRGALVPILSVAIKDGDGTPCATQSAPYPSPPRAQKRDTCTGVYEPHAVRTMRKV